MKHRIDKAIERYKLDEVNPDILAVKEVVNRFQYDLWSIESESNYYDEIVDSIDDELYHPATLRELLDWDGWDKETTVVACGTTFNINGRTFVPCYCADMVCEVTKDGEVCKKIRRIALLATDLVWKGKIGVLQVRN